MAAPDDNDNRPEENNNSNDNNNNAPEVESEESSPEIESSDPLAYINMEKRQVSKTQSPQEGLDEAMLLHKAGWRLHGPYYRKDRDQTFIYMQSVENSNARVYYYLHKHIDSDGIELLQSQQEDNEGSKKATAAAAGKGGERAGGSYAAAGAAPSRAPRSTNKPEEDPSHALYPYLSKEDSNRPIVFDILKNAQNYQDVINDLGWEAMVTLLQIVKIDPRALSENQKDFKKDRI